MLAQADTSIWVDAVSSLGFPIVVVLLILWGKLVPGFVYDRVVRDNDRMSEMLEEKVLPALIESTEVLKKATEALEHATRSSRR